MPVNGGVKNWIPTEVLSAADVNEYLADQTIARFDDIAARNAAYGVAGAPSLQAGLFCWVASTELLYYYDGTSWSEVGAQVDDGEITEAKLANNSVTSAKIVDGTIVNADISTSAGIALSKLATSTAGNIIVYNSSGVPTAVAETGDVTIDSSGVASIASGVIVNADISTSAAIDLSKLATSTAGNIIVYNSSGVPTSVAETGDVTIDSSGVTSISSGVIVNADISSTAAIEIGKIADVTIDSKSSTYTLALTDKNKFIEMTNSTSASVIVPTNSVAFPVGSQVHIVQNGTGKVHVVANTPGTTSIRSTPGQYLRAQYSSATLLKRATEEWYLVGDLSAT